MLVLGYILLLPNHYSFCLFSKSGRPPTKRMSDRRAFTRPGKVVNSGSSEFTGSYMLILEFIWLHGKIAKFLP